MATTKVNVSKISDFPKVTPAGTDYMLVEKDGQGGSITLSQIPVSTPVSTRIAGEVNTLNSRIDNIMASSGDDISEIVDARQGSDGTNYASLRARLDAENNQLKGDLVTVIPTSTIDANSVIEGQFINNNGILVSQSNYGYISNIDLKEGETIIVSTRLPSTVSVIASVSVSNFVPLVKGTDLSTIKKYTYTADKDITVACSVKTNDTFSIQIKTYKVDNMEKSLESIGDKLSADESKIEKLELFCYGKTEYSPVLIDGYLVRSDGLGVASSGGYVYSEHIPLEKGMTITIETYAPRSVAVISLYSNGNYIPKVNGIDIESLKLYEYDVEEDGDYVISYRNKAIAKIYIEKHQIKSQWKDKKIVFYGDSITADGRYENGVSERIGCNAVNMGIGGTRFVIGTSEYAQQTALSSDIRIATIPTDADAVVIMGGTNDFSYSVIEQELTYNDGFDRTKFKGAVAYTIKAIQDRCPNAVIILATAIGGRGSESGVIQPLPMVETDPNNHGFGNTPLKIRNAEIEVAEMLNIPVMDTWSCGINGFNRVQYIEDTVHPNADGYNLMAGFIAQSLNTIAPKS